MAEPDFDEAFGPLFTLAYRVGFRVLGSGAEAEDIAQETLARAYVRWRRVRGHAQPWVATVSLRLAIDQGRRRTRHPTAELSECPVADPDLAQRLDLVAALRRLSRRQQQVLACRYLAGLSDEQTAALLGVSTGSVKQHAARGLHAMRTELVGLGPDQGDLRA